ncbi:MAG: hypothetical protein KAJ62_06825 [Desulfobacteraceae bacterium]|nr:hypothetical protein [Desulfobacteraceae bacterium]
MKKRRDNVVGEYPLSLYRFFEKEEYALQFINEGKFRARFIEEYKKAEYDKRSDSAEGQGHYGLSGKITNVYFSKDPKIDPDYEETYGVQQHHSSIGNSIFLFCCSNSNVDIKKIKKKFGNFVVKICNPIRLARDIDFVLNGHEGLRNYLIDGKHVEYNKGEVLSKQRPSTELSDLSYTQKPKSFEDEKEFRFCLIGLGPERLTNENDKKFIDIDIGKKLKYLKML